MDNATKYVERYIETVYHEVGDPPLFMPGDARNVQFGWYYALGGSEGWLDRDPSRAVQD